MRILLTNRNRNIVVQFLAALTISILGAVSVAHEYSVEEIAVDHPWARPSRVATIPAAVYFDIVNKGAEHDRLISATTMRAEHVELHVTEMTDEGVAKMRLLKEGISAPADARRTPIRAGGLRGHRGDSGNVLREPGTRH